MNDPVRSILMLFIALQACPILLTAQTTLQGRVVDAERGEPLLYATVAVSGSRLGVNTDEEGRFALELDRELPVTLLISFVGYGTQEVAVSRADQSLRIALSPASAELMMVQVRGQRIAERQQAAPLTVESLDGLAIRETPSVTFYEGLSHLKGVDLTSASIGFKIINTRGFNSTSPVRTLQLIDGVDNQSPGLNFSLGNFLGSPELDVNRVDLIQGASSAFYGPNAFNGVISMQTKDPFIHQGLSATVKTGERRLLEGALRWADAIANRAGQPAFAYKLNLAYLQADDWPADNDEPITDSRVPADNPGRYDAVNTYGDEFHPGNDFRGASLLASPGLGLFYRTGYREPDLVDYDSRNLKANLALHWRTDPARGPQSPELILASNVGAGTTVYQGDNRFSLRNILFFQNRLEFRRRDKFFIRAYATHEDAGDSYDPFLTALRLQERAKSDRKWSEDYLFYWNAEVSPQILNDPDYPKLTTCTDPETGASFFCFDREAALQWLGDRPAELSRWHAEAEDFANENNNAVPQAFYQPGTPRFQEAFDELVAGKRTEGGTQFFDRSALYHVQGEYAFSPSFIDEWKVGASGRLYRPNSEGTVFSDTASTISNHEYGFYTGVRHGFFGDKLTLRATLRLDKNQNFDWLASPAASLVYRPAEQTFLRFSFSSAIRNPTLTDQYLWLDVGPAILSGNLQGAEDLVTPESLREYLQTQSVDALEYFDVDPIRPERVQTLEVGIRSTLFGSLYIDAGFYFNRYTRFIGYQIGADIELDPVLGLLRRLQVYRYAANSANTVTSQGLALGLNYYFGTYFMLNGNYAWNKLVKTAEDDPIIPAFNTPEHKFNLGFSGRDIPLFSGAGPSGFGFAVNYKWVEGFRFEGSPQFTGFVPTYDLLDAQVNYYVHSIHTTFKLGASNVLDRQVIQAYGGPRIGRLAYIAFTYAVR